jgi:hypothetical protein
MNRFVGGQPFTIQPQQIGQLPSIASIGFPLGRSLGMNEHDLSAVPPAQLLDEPIVETADFENRHELWAHFREFLKKRFDLLSTGADLPAQNRVPLFVADTNGDLLAVLVNGEVQHR